MSMQLSTFKNFFWYNKAQNQRLMFVLFLTAEISPLHMSVKNFLPKHLMAIFNLACPLKKFEKSSIA